MFKKCVLLTGSNRTYVAWINNTPVIYQLHKSLTSYLFPWSKLSWSKITIRFILLSSNLIYIDSVQNIHHWNNVSVMILNITLLALYVYQFSRYICFDGMSSVWITFNHIITKTILERYGKTYKQSFRVSERQSISN